MSATKMRLGPTGPFIEGATDGDVLKWRATEKDWLPSQLPNAFAIDLYNNAPYVTVAAVAKNATTLQTLTVAGVKAGDVVIAYQTTLPTSNVVCGAGVGTAPNTVSMPMFNVSATDYAGDVEAMLFLIIRLP